MQPYLDGDQDPDRRPSSDGIEPLRGFMLNNTDDEEIALLTDVAHRDEAGEAAPTSR